MKTRITVAALTAAALVAVPTTAMAGQGGQNAQGNSNRSQQRFGDCTGSQVSVGALTQRQLATLQGMAEEEKLAHDVYIALDAKFGGVVFGRIAASEAKHLKALQRLMDRYNVDDPTAGFGDGAFASHKFAKLYTDLLTEAATVEEAMAVGADIERMDIADLKDANAAATQRDLMRVYSNLLRGSERHLVAFTR